VTNRFYDDELAELGCGDGGCYIQAPRGMHTNGGCNCIREIRDVQTRMRVTRALMRYRQIVSVLAAAKLVPEKESAA